MTFIFAFTCLFSISAFAAEEQFQPRASLYFDKYSAEVDSEGGGDITITMSVTTKASVKELGFTKVIVQEKSGSSWTDVAKIVWLIVLPFLIAEQKAKAIVQR